VAARRRRAALDIVKHRDVRDAAAQRIDVFRRRGVAAAARYWRKAAVRISGWQPVINRLAAASAKTGEYRRTSYNG